VAAILFDIRDKAVKKETIPKEKKVKAVKEVKTSSSSSSSSSIAGTEGKKAKEAKATGGKGKAKKGSGIANANNNNNYATLGLGVGVESEFQIDQAYPISSDGITSYTPHYMNMNMGAGGGGSGTAGLQHSHSLNNSLDLMDALLKPQLFDLPPPVLVSVHESLRPETRKQLPTQRHKRQIGLLVSTGEYERPERFQEQEEEEDEQCGGFCVC
jgi:hypothetical protein